MSFSVRAALEQFTLPHPSGEGALTISVAPPAAPMPESGVPVLYVVDGDLLFGMAAEIARAVSSAAAFPAHYVVGIGYDADYADFLKRRTADLAPPIGAEALESLGGMAAAIGGAAGGGADAFLAFLTNRLRPEIAARYPNSADGPQILFGHSLGGLFAAHALLTRPGSFAAFIASSPSLWWNGFAILDALPAFKARLAALPRQPRVFVDVGAKEQELPTSVPDGIGVTLEEAQAQIRAARMVDAAKEFAGALGDAGLTDLRHIAFAEDDHVSAAPAAILHGMRFALGRDR
ncbi:putative esterase [uncultured Sphingopyxis sp.]|uniref:Putative esterase n=1 Tax=uncultured Sphingopyxis sp. TaxID=310581 RepID=A0A1Y5PW76_9SPHN|nr:alpha/beta hydrolase-fold protein [uncultured Sphingopyxis sp.]SBV34273.1 putative esterase [uncultured Sphingopyxis sp.]